MSRPTCSRRCTTPSGATASASPSGSPSWTATSTPPAGTYPDTGPALDIEAVQPRAPGDWHHHEAAARAFVAVNWPGEPGLASSWTDAMHPPALLSPDARTVYFPAAMRTAAADASRKLPRTEPDGSAHPLPPGAEEEDWLLIDDRGNVILQSGSALPGSPFAGMMADVRTAAATAREIPHPDLRAAEVITRLRDALERTGDLNAAFKEAVAPLRRDRAGRRDRLGEEGEP